MQCPGCRIGGVESSFVLCQGDCGRGYCRGCAKNRMSPCGSCGYASFCTTRCLVKCTVAVCPEEGQYLCADCVGNYCSSCWKGACMRSAEQFDTYPCPAGCGANLCPSCVIVGCDSCGYDANAPLEVDTTTATLELLSTTAIDAAEAALTTDNSLLISPLTSPMGGTPTALNGSGDMSGRDGFPEGKSAWEAVPATAATGGGGGGGAVGDGGGIRPWSPSYNVFETGDGTAAGCVVTSTAYDQPPLTPPAASEIPQPKDLFEKGGIKGKQDNAVDKSTFRDVLKVGIPEGPPPSVAERETALFSHDLALALERNNTLETRIYHLRSEIKKKNDALWTAKTATEDMVMSAKSRQLALMSQIDSKTEEVNSLQRRIEELERELTEAKASSFRTLHRGLGVRTRTELLALITEMEGAVGLIREELNSRSMCIVCYANPQYVLFMPCRHQKVCKECSDKLTSCPLCMGNISLRIEPFDG